MKKTLEEKLINRVGRIIRECEYPEQIIARLIIKGIGKEK